MYVIDPATERVTASHIGGLSLTQLTDLLDRGARGMAGGWMLPADSALATGDALLGRGQYAAAQDAYRIAIQKGGKGWSQRETTVAQLAWVLLGEHQYEDCAEMAMAEAPFMKNGIPFERVTLAGLMSANQRDTTEWAVTARGKLGSFAAEAVKMPDVSRNDRFQLYQELIAAAQISHDDATAKQWGDAWLGEIDRTQPQNEDERTALDVARVDAVSLLGTPERAIAPLKASEKAMPHNYNACLRLAQVQSMAKHYDEAIQACDRGLARVDGPLGRTWLLETKADALIAKGDKEQARQVLEDARASANAIVTKPNRDGNLRRIAAMMDTAGK